MKKTFNINISGYPFVIDEDAYNILESYLSTLGEVCRKAGQQETAVDIEQRISEIFSEKFGSGASYIISRNDVEAVITRIGAPELIVEEDGCLEAPDAAAASAAAPPPIPPAFPGVSTGRRLYRDINNKILGGVCSGLGWYMGIDPVWVRIVAVILTLFSVSTLALVYIILWIIVPAARSPYQRMQMMGMDPSMENIGRVVKGEYPGQPKRRRSHRALNAILLVLLILLLAGCLTFTLICD